MNYYDIVESITRGEKIYNLPLKVTYYCRVSTDSDVQLNSLDNQLEYYENYIRSKENWTFVDGYIEEVESEIYQNSFEIVNEEGLIKGLKFNKLAKRLLGRDYVGNVLICPKELLECE